MVRRFSNHNKVGMHARHTLRIGREPSFARHDVGHPSGRKRGETHMTTCPIGSCNREMKRHTSRFNDGHDPLNGLHHYHCSHCRHTGTIPAGEVQLLFRAGNQYVMAYGPSLSTITVVLTTRALTAYQSYALSSDELAKLVVGWALLSGTLAGTVTLDPERQEFLGFDRYLRIRIPVSSLLRAV